MHHSELRPKSEAVRAEVDEFIFHVISGRKLHHQPCPDDRLDICLRTVICEFLTL